MSWTINVCVIELALPILSVYYRYSPGNIPWKGTLSSVLHLKLTGVIWNNFLITIFFSLCYMESVKRLQGDCAQSRQSTTHGKKVQYNCWCEWMLAEYHDKKKKTILTYISLYIATIFEQMPLWSTNKRRSKQAPYTMVCELNWISGFVATSNILNRSFVKSLLYYYYHFVTNYVGSHVSDLVIWLQEYRYQSAGSVYTVRNCIFV